MKECKCKEHEGDRLLSEDNFGKNKRCADGLDYFLQVLPECVSQKAVCK